MKDKFKDNFKKYFKNMGPKAKKMLGVSLAIVVMAILTVTVAVSMRKVYKVDVDGEVKTFVTYKTTVAEALEAEGIEVIPQDKVSVDLNSKIEDGQKIEITKAVKVNVVILGQEHEFLTAEQTVEDMLNAEKEYIHKLGVDIDDDDEITPKKESLIYDNMNVKIVKVEVKQFIEQQEIAYNTVTKIDYNKSTESEDEVAQNGVNGTKDISYKVYKYEDGTERKVKLSEKISKEPQDKIIVKGGKKPVYKPNRSSSNGVVGKAGKVLKMDAVSYYCGPNAMTYTGRKAVRDPNGISTIAVDPTIIPLGSLVYVEGYGKAVAADIGTAIKGYIIDVYASSYQDSCRWGRHVGISVQILAGPGEW